MAPPRIAVCQAPYVRDVDSALSRAIHHIRQAASHGVDIVVFPEWFFGLNPVEVIPNRITDRISRVARELNVMIVSGSVRALEPATGKKQQRSLVIERDGTLAGSQPKMSFSPTERPWFEPGTGVIPIPTRWGRIVVLPGLDALDPERWSEVIELVPDLVVMAANPKNLAERSQMQELTLSRSLELQATIVLSPLLGRFSGSHYIGGALIAYRGRIQGQAEEEETVLLAGDPASPLIQLGVTDVSSSIPLTPPLVGDPPDPGHSLGPEAERRVLLDWGMLRSDDVMRDGEELLTLSRDNPRWAALAPARPDAIRQLKSLLELGAHGAFAYPGLDRLFPWSEAIRPIGQALTRYRRPLLVHAGPGSAPLRFDGPALWDEFLSEFPEVPLIIMHMGRCSPYLEEALVLAERHSSVYLETSGAPLGAIKEAIHSSGPDRILFGSGGISYDFQLEWEKIERLEAEISPDAFQKITGQNARRLFFAGDTPHAVPSNVHPFRRPS